MFYPQSGSDERNNGPYSKYTIWNVFIDQVILSFRRFRHERRKLCMWGYPLHERVFCFVFDVKTFFCFRISPPPTPTIGTSAWISERYLICVNVMGAPPSWCWHSGALQRLFATRDPRQFELPCNFHQKTYVRSFKSMFITERRDQIESERKSVFVCMSKWFSQCLTT